MTNQTKPAARIECYLATIDIYRTADADRPDSWDVFGDRVAVKTVCIGERHGEKDRIIVTGRDASDRARSVAAIETALDEDEAVESFRVRVTKYRIEARLAGQPWHPGGSGDTYHTREDAEAAMDELEPSNDAGATIEYRVVDFLAQWVEW